MGRARILTLVHQFIKKRALPLCQHDNWRKSGAGEALRALAGSSIWLCPRLVGCHPSRPSGCARHTRRRRESSATSSRGLRARQTSTNGKESPSRCLLAFSMRREVWIQGNSSCVVVRGRLRKVATPVAKLLHRVTQNTQTATGNLRGGYRTPH